jgi:hypothetical protein
MSKLIRHFDTQVRIIDAQRGLVDYVASDETLDSYREIIKASGWKFTRFERNAPFVDSHDYYTIGKLLGRVLEAKVEGNQLIERVQWAVEAAEVSPLVALGWKLTTTGYLKAVSVGFIPVVSVSRWDADSKPFADACTQLGLDTETAATVRCIYLEQEQIELSACIIGSNPNAVAKAHQDGAIRDADLDAVGFDDEAMQMLHEFAVADEQANPQSRLFLRNLCAAYFQTLSVRTKTQNPSPADGRAAADEVQQRSRERFLAELKNATQSIH